MNLRTIIEIDSQDLVTENIEGKSGQVDSLVSYWST